MAKKRIYLGVDTHSNLAVSLELDGEGTYVLIISTSADGHDLCRFQCTEEDLQGIVENKALELAACQGLCTVHSTGDEVIFEYKKDGSVQASACALSANSFNRVLRLAKNRAFVG